MITFAPVCVAGASRKSCGAPGRRGPRLLFAWQAQYLEPPEKVLARLVAVGRGSCLRGRRGTWSIQKGFWRAWSPWAAAPVCVAGAVLGASRKGCGAPGRRGPRLLFAWQAQYLEPLERVAARLVAVGRGSCLRGRRSTWSLQKGFWRAWSPWAAASVCVAGAILGAFRKGCGAPCRRGPRLLCVWQAQYLEPPERVAARLVAVGSGSCLRGRRSTWSLQKGLRRAWSPWAGAVLGASKKGCGAPGRRGPRLLSAWQARYLEHPILGASRKGSSAPGRCGPRLLFAWQAQYWSLEKELRRGWSPWAAAPVCVAGAVLGASRKGCGAPDRRGPRLLFAWQAQYLELPERVAARLVAVGRGSFLCGRRSTWSFQKGLRRAWSLWAVAPVCVAGAVLGASRKGCGAPGRRGPRLLFAWQAQYLELPEKVAARLAAAPFCVAGAVLGVSRKGCGCLVAVGRGSCLCGRRSTWSLQKGLRRAWSPWAAAPVRVAGNTWSLQKGLRRAWSPWAAAPVCAAGAVLRASRKGCGAPGRRGPRLLSVWPAQYSELPERVAARLVAVGRGSCPCGRRSAQSL